MEYKREFRQNEEVLISKTSRKKTFHTMVDCQFVFDIQKHDSAVFVPYGEVEEKGYTHCLTCWEMEIEEYEAQRDGE